MRDIQRCSRLACIVYILTGTTRPLASNSFTMIIKLQRNARDTVAGGLEQSGDDRGVHATRHGRNDKRAPAIGVKPDRLAHSLNYRPVNVHGVYRVNKTI